MNIESSNINRTNETQTTRSKSLESNKDSSVKFADELKESKTQNEPTVTDKPVSNEPAAANELQSVNNNSSEKPLEPNLVIKKENPEIKLTNPDETLFETKDLNQAIVGLSSIVQELNQSDEKPEGLIKNDKEDSDNNIVINNEFNIQENKDIMPQMNPNMNFSGNGQPFSSFMNDDSEKKQNSVLESSAKDLAEEAAVLSTMAENIAIANKNQAIKNTRTIINEEGVKKVDTQTGIKVENIVKYDTVIMNQADVEIFVNLVENGEVNVNQLTQKNAEQSVQISKTLADMIAKSMEKNQPLRIDFDNNISVIIKVSKDGKITADFLPSSQVAETYLKENLPLLRQRFDDNNIEYDSLNQRERRNPDKKENRKKDRSNE